MDELEKLMQAVMEHDDVSYSELATKTGISKSTLQRYVTQGLDAAPLQKVKKMAEALGIPERFVNNREALSDELTSKGISHVLRMISEGLYRPSADEITFDDFTYAMYKEGRELSEEKKNMLISMARFFKQEQDEGRA